MAVELVAGVGLIALLLGVGLGYLLASRSGPKARVMELERALDAAQSELSDYKRDVYGQFAQTAEKFRDLDRSYNELHRQLAESSVALCGDAATPLLQAADADQAVVRDQIDEDIIVAETTLDVDGEVEVEAEVEAEGKVEDEGEGNAEAEIGSAGEPVPTLTNVDAEDTDTRERRESA